MDIFVARYNPNLILSWAKSAEGSDYDDRSYGITTSEDDSTIITGRFEGTAIFGAGDPNQTTLFAAGYRDIFVMRYNADGTLHGLNARGGTGWDLWNRNYDYVR